MSGEEINGSASGPSDLAKDFELKFEPYEPPVRPIWRFVIAAVFLQGIDWLAVNAAYHVLPSHPIMEDALYRICGTIFALAGFYFMLRTFDEIENKSIIDALGFPRVKAFRELSLGLVIGFALIATAILINFVLTRQWPQLTIEITPATLKKLFEVTVLLGFGALYEELSFRGYAFQRLRMSVGSIGAILIFSIWFGTVHLANLNSGGVLSWAFLNTITIGTLLAVAYLRTGALWMPIGIHFSWNYSLGVIFGLPVSGLDFFAVIVHGRAIGPKLLTGGSYGLEASLTGAVVILLGFIPVMMLTRQQPSSI